MLNKLKQGGEVMGYILARRHRAGTEVQESCSTNWTELAGILKLDMNDILWRERALTYRLVTSCCILNMISFYLLSSFFNHIFLSLSLFESCSSVQPTELNAAGRHSHRGPSPGRRARDHRHSDEGWHQDLGSYWRQAGDCHQHRWEKSI